MKVILIENVPHVGKVGEIVNVSDGHARNYLIPNHLAYIADRANKKQLEDHLRRLSKKIANEKELATKSKNKLANISLQFVKKVGINYKLFGSVTTAEISEKLKSEHEVEVESRLLSLSAPVRRLGDYEVKAKLFPGVEALFTIKVVADPESIKKIEKEQKERAERKALEKKTEQEKGAEAAQGEDVSAEGANQHAEEAEEKEVKSKDKKKSKKELEFESFLQKENEKLKAIRLPAAKKEEVKEEKESSKEKVTKSKKSKEAKETTKKAAKSKRKE